MVITIIEWIIWGVVAFLGISWSFGVYTYLKEGKSVQFATMFQSAFFIVIAVVFLFLKGSKLHILWTAPASFFLAILLGIIIGRNRLMK